MSDARENANCSFEDITEIFVGGQTGAAVRASDFGPMGP